MRGSLPFGSLALAPDHCIGMMVASEMVRIRSTVRQLGYPELPCVVERKLTKQARDTDS